jgi:hypothetical protein
MRTTVRLDDALLIRAKREAARRNQTLTSLIDSGLRLVLDEPHGPRRRRRRVVLPVGRTGGGLLPGVNLDKTSALLDMLDAADGKWR